MLNTRSVGIIVLIAAVGLWSTPVDTASHPPARGSAGMVSSDTELAAAAGLGILRAGGNAVDAAIATAFALGVISPQGSGIGGGGFALVYNHEAGTVTALDFREMAPAGASRDMFVVDGDAQSELSLRSGLAVGVPGEVAGLWALHQHHGQLPWTDVMAPAVRLAAEGFDVDHALARGIEAHRENLEARPDLLAEFTTEAGVLAGLGDRLTRPALADTLRAIAAQGPEAFYSGPVAEAIVSEVQAAGGVMTIDDLSAYRVAEREPIVGSYRGHTLYTMPPPSSGGTTMLAALNVLEGYELAGLGHGSSAHLHLLTEALKFSFADRAEYLGDADFVEVPVAELVDPSRAEARRALIQLDTTLAHDVYGQAVPPPDDAGTSHLSVVDDERNVVALTTTINTGFGSQLLVDGYGIILNNEMDDFSAQPGVPNAYGLVGSEANAVAAGKRPLSSMSPTIVLRDGQPVLTAGGSGGPAIITATLQVISNVIDFDMTVREAVEAPRIHHQWTPDILFTEREIPRDVRDNLRGRGHNVVDPPFGAAVQAIVIDGEALYGASDPRKGGVTFGF